MTPCTASSPWEIVGCDIFHYGVYHYLIMTDYYSSFPEVLLTNKGPAHGTSTVVIEKIKSIFSRNGIPDSLISDGGPQFSSQEFEEFALTWGFKHEKSDPHFPRGNAKVERSVQTIKNLIMKAHASNMDPYSAILAHRTSPIEGGDKSPADLFYNRHVRTKLNAHVPLPPGDHESYPRYDAKYANMHTRELPPLHNNDNVRIKGKKGWPEKARVVSQFGNNSRSYIVETLDGRKFRRNRQQLLRTREDWPKGYIDHLDDDVPSCINNDSNDLIDRFNEINVNEQDIEICARDFENSNFNASDYRRFSSRENKGKIDRFQPY